MNREISADWKEYYQETDPLKRAEILKKAEESDGESELLSLRKRLFRSRYGRRAGNDKDVWLGCFLDLLFVYSRLSTSAPRAYQRDIGKIEKTLFQELKNHENDDLIQNEVYWELRNTVRRYIETCQSAQYGRTMFGLKAPDEKKREKLIFRDIYNLSYGIAKKMDVDENMQILCAAAKDEFCSRGEESEKMFLSVS